MDVRTTAAAPTPESLAVRYLDEVGRGGEPDLEALAAELPGDEARAELRRLVADSLELQGLLPVQVRPGTVLCRRYRVVREIGAGGMGKVFEAFDTSLQRTVAVKVLAVFGAAHFDPEQLFRKEALLLATMQHPNIVAVHEIARDGDVTFLVMEFVRGVPLSTVVERVSHLLGGAPPRAGDLLERALGLPHVEGRESLVRPDWFSTAAAVALEVARTLEAAHAAGLVHRDVKPGNVMLEGGGRPVVLDFGLAGVRDQQGGELTQGLFGSVAYLAPEQAQQMRSGVDPRTDVYQLGALLYELLVLRRAFPGSGVTEILGKVAAGQFVPPRALDRGVPFELEAVCLKAMELDPERRYPSMRALREDIERFVVGVELPLAAASGRLGAVLRRARYFVRRRRVATFAVATLLCGLLAGWLAKVLPAEPEIEYFVARQDEDGQYSPELVLSEAEVGGVREGDVLCIRIECDEPRVVYVLSVFGERAPPTFVAPMAPLPLAEYLANPERAGSSGFRVELQPGRHEFACASIVEYDPAIPYEGLWVLTSSEPRPQIETWMSDLARAGGLAERLPYERALALLDEPLPPEVTRGGQPTRAAAQQIARVISAADLFEGNEWPYDDPRLHERFFPVEAR